MKGFACDQLIHDANGNQIAHPVAVAMNKRFAEDERRAAADLAAFKRLAASEATAWERLEHAITKIGASR